MRKFKLFGNQYEVEDMYEYVAVDMDGTITVFVDKPYLYEDEMTYFYNSNKRHKDVGCAGICNPPKVVWLISEHEIEEFTRDDIGDQIKEYLKENLIVKFGKVRDWDSEYVEMSLRFEGDEFPFFSDTVSM